MAHLAGSGCVAGSGGIVKVSSQAKVYAFNGNRYTDGTDYENGLNQCPIYAQNGIKLAKYKHSEQTGYVYVNLELEYEKSTITTLSYKNPLVIGTSFANLTIDSNIPYLNNIDMSRQGIGSGAGYIELSNGTYTVDSTMD